MHESLAPIRKPLLYPFELWDLPERQVHDSGWRASQLSFKTDDKAAYWTRSIFGKWSLTFLLQLCYKNGEPNNAMTHTRGLSILFAGLVSAITANANLVSVTQSGPGTFAVPPQIESTPFGEESFAYVNRTHEITSARTDPTTGLLTTAATGNLVGFPSYLIGLQYVANANDNRSAGTAGTFNSYTVTYTVDSPSVAYLLLDNRIDGPNGNVLKANTTDPIIGGDLSWVTSDGWSRVNTGIMPNGQADYIGIDEGATVATPDLRTHHDPGPGQGLNNFFSIYTKNVPAGTFQTYRDAGNGGNMYVVAVAAVPEPSTFVFLGLGVGTLVLNALRKRR